MSLSPPKITFMIVAIAATIHEIAELGESFKWPDGHCEKCSRKMWGHGFVGRYFDGVAGLVRIKRLICPGCGVVVTFRPQQFYSRFRSSIVEIYEALTARLKTGFWPEGKGFKRQRGWYWLKKLMSTVLMNSHPEPSQFLNDRFAKEVQFFV